MILSLFLSRRRRRRLLYRGIYGPTDQFSRHGQGTVSDAVVRSVEYRLIDVDLDLHRPGVLVGLWRLAGEQPFLEYLFRVPGPLPLDDVYRHWRTNKVGGTAPADVLVHEADFAGHHIIVLGRRYAYYLEGLDGGGNFYDGFLWLSTCGCCAAKVIEGQQFKSAAEGGVLGQFVASLAADGEDLDW